MKALGVLLMLLPAGASAQLVNVQSPALEQLKGVEGSAADQDRTAEGTKAKGGLGFTVVSLEPQGFVSADGKTPPPQDQLPADPKPRKAGSGSYIFEGKTPIKGVTIYTPKEDPTGNGRTEKPAPEGPVSKKMLYGALLGGVAATIGGFFFPPLLFLGGLLLGAGAVLWFINKKFAK